MLGGKVELQANSLAILRIEGQDTQRAFASARWDLRRLTALGQELTFTAYARGDVYHSDDTDEHRGRHLSRRGRLARPRHRRARRRRRWPFIGAAFGGTQRLTPRVQLVLTPPTTNLDIPNEDARSVDLEDSNLFALNRFPGYDRWEDGSRVTYGLDWSLDRPEPVDHDHDRPKLPPRPRKPSIFPDGTGLTDRFSDIVGRTRVRFGRFIDLTHRFRVDKDNLAVRRNEIDLTVGGDQTYAQIGYLRLNRDIDADVEDLRDKEELRLAGRFQVRALLVGVRLDRARPHRSGGRPADRWPTDSSRSGTGSASTYEDECLELGVSWRRDYERIGEFRQGQHISRSSVALKGLGR